MVWPDNHATTAGLRAITRLKYSKSPFKKVSVAVAVRGDLESVEEGTNLDDQQTAVTEEGEGEGENNGYDGERGVAVVREKETNPLSVDNEEQHQSESQSVKMEGIIEAPPQTQFHAQSTSLPTSTSTASITSEEQSSGRVRKQTNLDIYTSVAVPVSSAKKSDRIKSESITSSTPLPSGGYGVTSVGTKSHKKRELAAVEALIVPSPKIVKTKKAKHIVPDG
jgi:hypothetical protein